MKITDIRKKKSNPRYYLVFIDGKSIFSITKERVNLLNLKIGKNFKKSEIIKILDDEEKNSALEYAKFLLSYCMRTKKEIIQRLERKKFSSHTISKVIEKLSEEKYIDDFAFSKSFIEERLKRKFVHPDNIYLELVRKGMEQDIAKKALQEILGTIDFNEEKLAWQAIKKKITYYTNPKIEKSKSIRRVHNFLLRRGFSYDITKNIVNKIFYG